MSSSTPAACAPAHPLFDLRDRVVIVTGAGQGIGRAFAQAFASAGAIAVIADLDAAKSAAVAAEIVGAGGRAEAMVTDVAAPHAVAAMAAAVMARCGRIDALINNAAIFSTLSMRGFEDIPPAEWQRVLDVNINGVFHACRAVVPAMRAAGRGRIVNIGSSAVTLGRGNYLHYTTSKAALIGLTRSLARELGGAGITVNTLVPGPTFTEIERQTVSPAQKEWLLSLQCIPRPEVPADLVGTALFLVSDAAAFLTGQAVTVDGGATHP